MWAYQESLTDIFSSVKLPHIQLEPIGLLYNILYYADMWNEQWQFLRFLKQLIFLTNVLKSKHWLIIKTNND